MHKYFALGESAQQAEFFASFRQTEEKARPACGESEAQVACKERSAPLALCAHQAFASIG